MKRFFKVLSVLIAAVLTVAIVPVSASAGSINESKEGVVLIESEFVYSEAKPFIFRDVNNNDDQWIDEPFDEMIIRRSSGFVVGKEGDNAEYIVTSAGAVLDDTAEYIRAQDDDRGLITRLDINSLQATRVNVFFSEAAREVMSAQIIHVDEQKNICILKLPKQTDLRKPLVLCRSEDRDPNDNDCAAVGFPGNMDLFREDTDRKRDIQDMMAAPGGISGQSTDRDGVSVYQITTDIYPGNAGGPFVNSKGEVLGINTYIVPDADNDAVLNYAVVIDELIPMLDTKGIPYTLSVDSASGAGDGADDSTESSATTATSVNEKPEPTPPINTVTVVIIVAAAAIVVAAVVVVIVVSKNKKPSPPVPPKPQNGAVIIGMKGIMANRSININGSIVIGRNPQKCSVSYPVDAKGISQVHCQIRQANGGYEIVDLGSSNGTFLGSGQRLTPNIPVFIPDGTYFYLGSAEQLFRIKY